MAVKKVTLSLDEASEIRCLLKNKIDDISLKLSVIDKNSDDSLDKKLYSFWSNKKELMIDIYKKLSSLTVKEVVDAEAK